MTTVTDRTRASTRDRVHDVKEKVLDTVYIQRGSVAVKEISAQSQNEGSVGRNGKREGLIAGLTHNLKWLCFAVLAITILIIVFRIFIKR